MKSLRGKTSPLPASGPPLDDADAEGVFSVGQYLKSQRVLRGISVEELSLRTRIPKRSIDRLEAQATGASPPVE